MKTQLLTLFTSLTLSSTLFASTLIVYNSNIGLVHESKSISIKKDDTQIRYEDVASTINTDSVNVTLPPYVTLYSQQYRYDKLTQEKLLKAYLNKEIQTQKKKHLILLSYDAKNAIVRTQENNIISIKNDAIIFSHIPKTLSIKPSLVWNIQTDRAVKTDLELDYIIRNISFQSDYILNLDTNSAHLTGWINIKNNSGKNFKKTKLLLLAGDVNRVHTPTPLYRKNVMSIMSDAPHVEEHSLEGYHLYSVPFRVNLSNNENTQIKFITKKSLPIIREYKARLFNPLYLSGESKSNFTQYIALKGIDVALPEGTIRTYVKRENDTILLGETHISHTPKNTPLQLKLGTNFDLKATQTLLKREDTKYWFNVDVKYSIQNSSNEQKSVQLLIPFNKKSNSLIKTQQDYTFTQGNMLTFQLNIKANSIKSFNIHFESKK